MASCASLFPLPLSAPSISSLLSSLLLPSLRLCSPHFPLLSPTPASSPLPLPQVRLNQRRDKVHSAPTGLELSAGDGRPAGPDVESSAGVLWRHNHACKQGSNHQSHYLDYKTRLLSAAVNLGSYLISCCSRVALPSHVVFINFLSGVYVGGRCLFVFRESAIYL